MASTDLPTSLTASRLHPELMAFLAFLDRFCARPEVLVPLLERQPRRQIALRDGEYLCRKGDQADAMWVILRGQVRIEDGQVFGFRKAGDLVGELAFYRVPRSHDGRRRGADLRANGDVTVFRIDASFVERLDAEAAVVWHETVASVATSKIDDAQAQRLRLSLERSHAESLLSKFVCEEGMAAARASITGDEPIDAERTDVLVWFSDIAGFSAHAQGLAADEVGRLVRELMDVQIRAIAEAGGQVDKLMGDGLMAFWRLPDRDRALREVPAAVRSALITRDNLIELVRSRGLPLDVRIGLHFGQAVLGDFGGSDRIAFTLIGDTVNRASRYEQAKACQGGLPLGRIRLSPEVFKWLGEDLIRSFERAPRQFSDKHDVAYDVHASVEGAER